MTNLTRASRELFSRSPDECFESLEALGQHCERQRERSSDLWCPPADVSNHIVWDAVETVDFPRRHTGAVTESLDQIRRIVSDLTAKRDARKDEFAKVVAKAMQEKVGDTSEEASAFLAKHGISRSMIKKAIENLAKRGESFNLWSLVDALTQLTREIRFAGDRTEADQKVSRLLSLAA